MLIRCGLSLLALVLLLQRPAAGRVFLMSLDAVGYERLTADPVARELTTLQSMLSSGAYADGLTPAFPSTTANGHAALWTGAYAGRNGIIYNQTPPRPRENHAFTERINGFRSEALTAEPIWVTASRQQVPVVAHQVTQAVPFLPQTVGAAPGAMLAIVNGFQSRTLSRWRAVRSGDADVHRNACEGWPNADARQAACFDWSLGPDTGGARVFAMVRSDRVLIATAPGGATVEARQHAVERELPRQRPLARFWSEALPIPNLPAGAAASLVFRAFEIDPIERTFLLIQGPLQDTAVYSNDPSLARAMIADTGPMIGNGATALYGNGTLGVRAFAGGNGDAERRFLETLELVVKQQIAQSKWLFERRRPRLHISYVSTADDVDHAWYGLDRAGDQRYTEFRRWGYAALEHAVRAFASLAGGEDHVVFTSDHGMAAVDRSFDVDQVLANAGLQSIASAINTCILLNTTDWKGGVIAPDSRDAAIERVRAALTAPRTPAGGPVVTKIYWTREEMAAFGHDGPGGADMCFELAPGISPADWNADTSVVLSPPSTPRGVHGLDPSRAEMKAMLLVKGPRALRGSMGRLKSGVVAPLVADLLGMAPPRDAAFSSPLGPSPR